MPRVSHARYLRRRPPRVPLSLHPWLKLSRLLTRTTNKYLRPAEVRTRDCRSAFTNMLSSAIACRRHSEICATQRVRATREKTYAALSGTVSILRPTTRRRCTPANLRRTSGTGMRKPDREGGLNSTPENLAPRRMSSPCSRAGFRIWSLTLLAG